MVLDVLLKHEDGVGFSLVPTEERVAGLAQQRADLAGRVAVIDKQAAGFALTDRARPLLLRAHRVQVRRSESVGPLEALTLVVEAGLSGIPTTPCPESGVAGIFARAAVVAALSTATLDAEGVPGPAARGLGLLAIEQGDRLSLPALWAPLVSVGAVFGFTTALPLLPVEYFHRARPPCSGRSPTRVTRQHGMEYNVRL